MTNRSILKSDSINNNDAGSQDEQETTSNHSSSDGGGKEVRWGDITLYEFPNLLGDNPAVSEGAPLTIGWKHTSVVVVAVEYHEFMKQSQPVRRRKDLIMSGGARDTL